MRGQGRSELQQMQENVERPLQGAKDNIFHVTISPFQRFPIDDAGFEYTTVTAPL